MRFEWPSARLIRHLEQQIRQLRQDYEERLQEYRDQNRLLREELADIKLVRGTIKALPPPVTITEYDGPLDWAAELRGMLKEQEEANSGDGK